MESTASEFFVDDFEDRPKDEEFGERLPEEGGNGIRKRVSSSSVRLMKGTRRKLTTVELFEQIRHQKNHQDKARNCYQHSIFGTYHAECLACAERNREYLRSVRQAAIRYPDIYSWTYIDPQASWGSSHAINLFGVFLAVAVQLFLPAAIAFQLYNWLLAEEEGIMGSLCPHRAKENKNLGKAFAFVLSALFGSVSLSNCLNKLRGNTFLLSFSPLSAQRRAILILGLLAQTAGLVAANVAEYLLFIFRGSDDFLLMMFTSLTMQFSLNADSVSMSELQKGETEEMIGVLLSDITLDLGDAGGTIPDRPLGQQLHNFRAAYIIATMTVCLFVVVLAIAVTFCI